MFKINLKILIVVCLPMVLLNCVGTANLPSSDKDNTALLERISELESRLTIPQNSEGGASGEPFDYTALRQELDSLKSQIANTKGEKGDPGNDGTNGVDGLNGQNGSDGQNGRDGADGQSIKGDTGAKGDQGLSIKGDKGDKGDPGNDGDEADIHVITNNLISQFHNEGSRKLLGTASLSTRPGISNHIERRTNGLYVGNYDCLLSSVRCITITASSIGEFTYLDRQNADHLIGLGEEVNVGYPLPLQPDIETRWSGKFVEFAPEFNGYKRETAIVLNVNFSNRSFGTTFNPSNSDTTLRYKISGVYNSAFQNDAGIISRGSINRGNAQDGYVSYPSFRSSVIHGIIGQKGVIAIFNDTKGIGGFYATPPTSPGQ